MLLVIKGENVFSASREEHSVGKEAFFLESELV